MTRVHIARPEYKFSCAHMTVFPDGTKERLHGHNYTLAIEVELADGGEMLAFAALREALAAECALLRERLLLPGRSPHLALTPASGGELEFRMCGQRYVVPEGDALVLPIDNVTVEELTGYLLGKVVARLEPMLRRSRAVAVELTVEESPGQGARAGRRLSAP